MSLKYHIIIIGLCRDKLSNYVDMRLLPNLLVPFFMIHFKINNWKGMDENRSIRFCYVQIFIQMFCTGRIHFFVEAPNPFLVYSTERLNKRSNRFNHSQSSLIALAKNLLGLLQVFSITYGGNNKLCCAHRQTFIELFFKVIYVLCIQFLLL